MNNCTLESVADLIRDPIECKVVTVDNYISTENMIPNKGGVTTSSSLPKKGKVNSFKIGDILISNIRPYFKKIWLAEFDGYCSQDVLVIRPKQKKETQYLYAVLSQDAFFDYSTKSTKGTKMPRGDIVAINKYLIPDLSENGKCFISRLSTSINAKIQVNNQINKNLLDLLKLSYKTFSEEDQWPKMPASAIAEKIGMGPFGSAIKAETFQANGVPIINGQQLNGFFVDDNFQNFISEDHADCLNNSVVYPGDLVFTHRGTLGQVSLIPNSYNHNRYMASQSQFYLRPDLNKISPIYLLCFFQSRIGQHELLSFSTQTGVPALAQPVTNLKKLSIPVPPIGLQREWEKKVVPMVEQYLLLSSENKQLTTLRDYLLPKLLSGKVEIQ